MESKGHDGGKEMTDRKRVIRLTSRIAQTQEKNRIWRARFEHRYNSRLEKLESKLDLLEKQFEVLIKPK